VDPEDDRCTHGGYERDCIIRCECGRGDYCRNDYSSCYDCFLDRRSEYVTCIYCGRWHSPDFDTCFSCRPHGRDEAATALKLVILTRDSFRCRYCGAREGDLQEDPRLARPKCPLACTAEHNHRRACKKGCDKRHSHRRPGDDNLCQPDCSTPHTHLIKDDDGIRAAKLHIDHIKPCAVGGTADPWNLQTLCGVCNIGKGSEWWPFCRHDRARQLIIAAYATYLWDFLTPGPGAERARLNSELELNPELDEDSQGWDQADQWEVVRDDYLYRIKASRPRPKHVPEVVVEDVPAEYAFLDVPPRATGAA